jgi:hypothetical protein
MTRATSLSPGPPRREDAPIMRKPAIAYVESSVPEYMTIAEYRRSRPRRAPKRGLRGLVVLRPRLV